MQNDPFFDEQGRPRVLRGAAIISSATKIAEMAGRLG